MLTGRFSDLETCWGYYALVTHWNSSFQLRLVHFRVQPCGQRFKKKDSEILVIQRLDAKMIVSVGLVAIVNA